MSYTQDPASWSTKIVIIDDDLVPLLILERVLKQEGFRVLKASSGPEGRALVAAEAPDLVLLDIQMPGESGLEACARLKAEPATADIPIIFLTGTGDFATKLEGFRVGAADYIIKPYQSEEVLARIQVHIRARKAVSLLAKSQLAQLDRLGSAMQAILADPAALPMARYAVQHRPLTVAGGDFYEVMQVGDQVFDYVVADVCGHDADASLVTSALKVLLYQGSSTLNSPMDSIRMINQAIHQTFPEQVYLSLAWLRLNRNRNLATLWLAGHPPLLLLRAGTGEVATFPSTGDVLGMFDSIQVEESPVAVTRGDRLLLFTDGLIELPQPDGRVSQARGLERLAAAALAQQQLPLEAMVAGTLESLTAEARQVADDLLLLGVEV